MKSDQQISVILIQVYWIKVFRACYVTPTLTMKKYYKHIF